MLDFKASSHKPVIAYGYQGYSQGDYYVATVADSVLLNPVGAVDVHGLAAVTPYFKTLLDKVGVKMQILRVGTYKSAVEPFMLDSISPANREQQSLFLGNVWRVMAGEMARSRDIAPAQFNAMADSLMLTMTAPALKAGKLIDGTCYKPEMEDKIRRIAGLEQDDDLRLASPELVASHYDNGSNKDGIVAVVYAVGEIDGSTGPMADGAAVDGKRELRLGRNAAAAPGLVLFVAPDVLGQFGMVDEGVAVFLLGGHGLVAVEFFLADRVLAVPFQQKVDGPVGEGGIAVVGQHIAVPARDAVVIGGGHVEVRAGEIALVLVVGLEDTSAVAGEGGGAELAQGLHAVVGAQAGAVGALTEGIVGALAVDLAVGGKRWDTTAIAT